MKHRTLLACVATALLTALLAAQAQVPGVNSTLSSVFTLAYDNSTMKPTYSATTILTPFGGATDVCSISGSATKTVKVRRIIFAGVASAVQTQPVAIIKRSTANTNGGGYSIAKVSYDSSNAASTVGTAEAWTTDPTLGTTVGTLADLYVQWANATTGLGSVTTFTFGQLGQPIVLRGVAQSAAVNLGGVNYTSPTISCTFEWTEE